MIFLHNICYVLSHLEDTRQGLTECMSREIGLISEIRGVGDDHQRCPSAAITAPSDHLLNEHAKTALIPPLTRKPGR